MEISDSQARTYEVKQIDLRKLIVGGTDGCKFKSSRYKKKKKRVYACTNRSNLDRLYFFALSFDLSILEETGSESQYANLLTSSNQDLHTASTPQIPGDVEQKKQGENHLISPGCLPEYIRVYYHLQAIYDQLGETKRWECNCYIDVSHNRCLQRDRNLEKKRISCAVWECRKGFY